METEKGGRSPPETVRIKDQENEQNPTHFWGLLTSFLTAFISASSQDQGKQCQSVQASCSAGPSATQPRPPLPSPQPGRLWDHMGPSRAQALCQASQGISSLALSGYR